MLDRWNDIGNKLIAMAQDFPEGKYDFKVQKGRAHLCSDLLHAAALDLVLIRRISDQTSGPDFGEGDNPSRDLFKTKADVVKFVQEAVADGAKVIQRRATRGWIKHRNLGTGWPTTPTSGWSLSSTAASTMASLWSTIVRTTSCHLTRGDSVDRRGLPWTDNDYSMLKKNIEFRKQIADKIGVGSSSRTRFGPRFYRMYRKLRSNKQSRL